MTYLTETASATFSLVNRSMQAINAKYPFVCKVPLGVSVVGREINALILCCPGKRANGRVLFAAAFRGQEWITSLLLLRFCEEVCFCLQNGLSMAGVDVRRALAGRTLIMIPQVNPDGVEIALNGSKTAGKYADFVAALGGDAHGLWQANAKGVDLTRNFSVGFHTTLADIPLTPAADRFRGETPESEPETAALCALCRRMTLRHATALHTCGEQMYWNHGEHTPVPARMMAEIMASAAGYTTADTAAFSGFANWFVEEFHHPAFAVTFGKGQNPLPIEEVATIGKRVREMLLLNAMM